MRFLQKLKSVLIKPQTLLGLDIDRHSCKFVELSRTAGSYQVHTCKQVFFTQGNLPQAFNWSSTEFLICLQRVVREANFSTNQVALALPYSAVLFKTIELDKSLQDKEILLQIKEKITEYFNYPITELLIDFEILGATKNHADLNEIRYVAAKSPEVNLRVQALATANLQTSFVEVDSYALQRAAAFFLQKKYPNVDPVVVVYVTIEYLLFMVLENQLPVYVRSEHMVNQENLTTSFRYILQVFCKNNPNKQPKLILFCGLAVTTEFLQQIQSEVQITAALLDIFAALNFSQDSLHSTSEFVVAAGLAMRVAEYEY